MFKKLLYVFAISLLPVVELRGAIPAGAAMGLPFWACYLCAVVGNLLPVPFILLFIEKIFAFMKRHNIFPKLIGWLEEKAQKGARKVEGFALFGLSLFVMIPLPGTGAWTGALVAALFHMDRRRAFLSIVAGVLIAGVIMTLASYGVVGFLSIFL